MSAEVIIRNATIADIEKMLKIYAHYVNNTAISFEYDVPTIEEFNNRIKDIMAKYPCLVAEIAGKIVGYAYAQPFIKREAYKYSVELTIYLDHKFQHQGIGGKLYKTLENDLKEKNISNLYACVGYPEIEDEYLNMNSVNFHEHLGFKICGYFNKCGYKFNRWYSMVWMEKIIGEHV